MITATRGLCLLLLTLLAPAPNVRGEPELRGWLAGETLEEGLPALGAAYAVRARSGPNAADRRLFVFPVDRTFAELKPRVAELVGTAPGEARWYREGNEHLFEEDLASRQARANRGRKSRDQALAKRRAGWERMQKWLPSQKTDERVVVNAKGKLTQFAGIFSGLPQEARIAALAGRPVQVHFSQLTGTTQQLVYNQVKGLAQGSEGIPSSRFEGSRDFAQTVVTVTPHGTPDAPSLRLTLMMGPTGGPTIKDLLNPPSWNPANGWDWQGPHQAYRKRVRGPRDRDTNPALQVPITLTGGQEATIDVVLKELTHEAKTPLVGEYDPCIMNPYARTESFPVRLNANQVVGLPLWRALDVVCTQFDLDWTFESGWIYLRSPRTVQGWSGEVDLSPPEAKSELPVTR